VTYDFIACSQADALRRHLSDIIHYAHSLLLSISRRDDDTSQLLFVDPSLPRAPIIPLLTPFARSLAQHCQQRGFTVRAIVAPTVPRGKERVRICLHAMNTRAQVEGLAGAVSDWVQLHLNSTSRPMDAPRKLKL
jgi:8-amino-7-oxononanoate synthase